MHILSFFSSDHTYTIHSWSYTSVPIGLHKPKKNFVSPGRKAMCVSSSSAICLFISLLVFYLLISFSAVLFQQGMEHRCTCYMLAPSYIFLFLSVSNSQHVFLATAARSAWSTRSSPQAIEVSHQYIQEGLWSPQQLFHMCSHLAPPAICSLQPAAVQSQL